MNRVIDKKAEKKTTNKIENTKYRDKRNIVSGCDKRE